MNWLAYGLAGNVIVDLGQLEPAVLRQLNKAVKQGSLVKSRRYWDTLSQFAGLKLKTVYATPGKLATLVW